jgi:hypothetical protein
MLGYCLGHMTNAQLFVLIGFFVSCLVLCTTIFHRLRRPRPEQRVVLPLSTGVTRVKPGKSIKITARAQRTAFRPQWMFISGTTAGGASDWVINDITIAGLSQFEQNEAVPGDMFATGAIGSFDVANPLEDVSLVVTYIGGNPEGEVFYCSMIGAQCKPISRRKARVLRRRAAV